MDSKVRRRFGFSLIEVLIVLFIIAMLIQLSLPAVQMARERARIAQCGSNLRQVALAAQNHESALGHLPTGGWGWGWIGDPDRGTGEKQPGSWAYQLLPYMEGQHIYDIGRGSQGEPKHEALARLASSPLATLYCPSRRLPKAYPNTRKGNQLTGKSDPNLFWYNANRADELAKTDYAANVGARWVNWNSGPTPEEAAREENFYQLLNYKGEKIPTRAFNGVVQQLRPVSAEQITDGLSQTYFAGEKMMVFRYYTNGRGQNDDQSCWNGDSQDTTASTQWKPAKDMPLEAWKKLQKTGKVPFGSTHIKVTNMAFCDGSVRLTSNDIDRDVHRRYGNRHDEGKPRKPKKPKK